MKQGNGMHFRIAAAAVALALGGCVSLGSKVPASLLTLTPAASAQPGAGATGKLAEALMVMEPQADRRLAVQRVAVQVDASTVAYLKDAMWVERPSRLIRALLAETIRAKGTRLVFEDTQALAATGLRLSGTLGEMGYDAASQSVVVRYDAIKELPGGAIETRRFEARVPGVSARPESVGPALNEAANAVAKEVADWVG
jgi:cholesterol transport system auxiliary component